MITYYQSMVFRIEGCETHKALKKCEESLNRLWNNGIFTLSEFKRLDTKILNKQLKDK